MCNNTETETGSNSKKMYELAKSWIKDIKYTVIHKTITPQSFCYKTVKS